MPKWMSKRLLRGAYALLNGLWKVWLQFSLELCWILNWVFINSILIQSQELHNYYIFDLLHISGLCFLGLWNTHVILYKYAVIWGVVQKNDHIKQRTQRKIEERKRYRVATNYQALREFVGHFFFLITFRKNEVWVWGFIHL